MLKRFLDGLAFGAGFSIALVAIWVVVSLVLMPAMFSPTLPDMPEPIELEDGDLYIGSWPVIDEFANFSEMPVDDQIAAASVIALLAYEPAEDGRMQAIFSEVLKKADDVDFRYDVGDEFHSHSYYPDDTRSHDRAVVFFTGSPARMRYSTTFRGDRITGLYNMTEDMFRQKCADAE